MLHLLGALVVSDWMLAVIKDNTLSVHHLLLDWIRWVLGSWLDTDLLYRLILVLMAFPAHSRGKRKVLFPVLQRSSSQSNLRTNGPSSWSSTTSWQTHGQWSQFWWTDYVTTSHMPIPIDLDSALVSGHCNLPAAPEDTPSSVLSYFRHTRPDWRGKTDPVET